MSCNKRPWQQPTLRYGSWPATFLQLSNVSWELACLIYMCFAFTLGMLFTGDYILTNKSVSCNVWLTVLNQLVKRYLGEFVKEICPVCSPRYPLRNNRPLPQIPCHRRFNCQPSAEPRHKVMSCWEAVWTSVRRLSWCLDAQRTCYRGKSTLRFRACHFKDLVRHIWGENICLCLMLLSAPHFTKVCLALT